MSRLTLALDVMGGDIGPRITIPAALRALENDPRLHLMLFGDSNLITPLLRDAPSSFHSRLTICHCTHHIENHYGLSYALRHSKGSSLRLALEAVQKGEAQGCVSAGNTAALMGLAKVLVQPLPDISRPALISLLPTIHGRHFVMLDLGANLECDANQLHQFARMGAIFAEQQFHLLFPRIALLNIGVESIKGYKSIREAAQLIQQDRSLNYQGFIEGDLLLNGHADVIVCDGFVGNVALKTLEGAVKNILGALKGQSAPHSNKNETKARQKMTAVCRRLGIWLIKKWLKQRDHSLTRLNPDHYNGASLIGLRGVVVKSHGGANSAAFAQAIADATRQVEQNIPAKIAAGLQKYE